MPDAGAIETDTAPPSRDANPFATCWVRPGRLPYAAVGDDARPERMLDKLANAGWRGQLVGGHGSGKSTLLLTLRDELDRRDVPYRAIDARDPSRRWRTGDGESPRLLLVEGFERLRPCEQRRRLAAWRRAGIGCLVTTHRPLRCWPRPLPVLATLSPSETLLERLFQRLTAGSETPVGLEDAKRSLYLHRGDLRAVWFDLYDLHERLSHPERTAPTRVTYAYQSE